MDVNEKDSIVASGDNHDAASGDQVKNDSEAKKDDETKKDMVGYDSYKKVLAEKKALQQKIDAKKREDEERELKEQEEKGNLQAVNEALRKRLSETENNLKSVKEQNAFEKFSGHVKAKASALKCHDPDTLVNLLTANDISSVEVDDNFVPVSDDLDRLMDNVKGKYPYMFGKANVNHTPATNVNVAPHSQEPKTTKERAALAAQAFLNKK